MKKKSHQLSKSEVAILKAAKYATAKQKIEWLDMAMRFVVKTKEMREKQGLPFLIP